MRVERSAWAIATGEPSGALVGVYRFDHMFAPPPFADGLHVALWRTRREARAALPKVKGHSGRGLYPKARVVRARITIDASPPPAAPAA